MRCPWCGEEDTKVIDSRSVEGKKKRRRCCTKCGRRFNTFECVERPMLMVAKRDGSLEPFNRNKLIGGIVNSIKKRPVKMEQVNGLVDEIEAELSGEMVSTVSRFPTSRILCASSVRCSRNPISALTDRTHKLRLCIIDNRACERIFTEQKLCIKTVPAVACHRI